MDIVQALRAQLLGQFIDTVGVAAATAGVALPETLKAGQTLSATVLGEVADGKVAVRIAGQPVVADVSAARLPPEARLPGATLRLTVETAGALPRLSIAGVEAPPPAAVRGAQQLSTGDAPALRLVAPPGQPQAPVVTPLTVATAGRPAAPTLPPPSPLQAALKEAVTTAAARQGGAAPLYATLATVAARPDSPLPEPVRQIATLLLAGRIDAERPVTPDIVRQTFSAAGVGVPPTQDATPPLDVKTLLATLKTLLPRPAADAPPPLRSEAPLEPPRRDAAPAAQRPLPSALPADPDPKTIAINIRNEAEQALERAKLHSYVAIPEQRIGATDAPRPQQLQFELPVAFGQQTAMMGMRVERERRRRREGETPIDVWGIRFAIEADEIGAVHAHLRLTGQTLNVSLWADEAATHRAFVDALPLLEAALREAALEVGEVAVFSGKPQEARKAASGHFLDVSS
jgi:hypothetical protein